MVVGTKGEASATSTMRHSRSLGVAQRTALRAWYARNSGPMSKLARAAHHPGMAAVTEPTNYMKLSKKIARQGRQFNKLKSV
jgi:hypothetical protein